MSQDVSLEPIDTDIAGWGKVVGCESESSSVEGHYLTGGVWHYWERNIDGLSNVNESIVSVGPDLVGASAKSGYEGGHC